MKKEPRKISKNRTNFLYNAATNMLAKHWQRWNNLGKIANVLPTLPTYGQRWPILHICRQVSRLGTALLVRTCPAYTTAKADFFLQFRLHFVSLVA